MGETSNTIPPGGIGKLQWSDLWKGIIKSLSGLVVGLIIQMIDDGRLPTYAEIAPILKATVYFLVGYLGINAGTNNVGQLFKKDQPTTTVPAKELEKVIEKAAEVSAPK